MAGPDLAARFPSASFAMWVPMGKVCRAGNRCPHLPPRDPPLLTLGRKPCLTFFPTRSNPRRLRAQRKETWECLTAYILRPPCAPPGGPPQWPPSRASTQRSRRPRRSELVVCTRGPNRPAAIEDVIFAAFTPGRRTGGQFGRMPLLRLLAARQRFRRHHDRPVRLVANQAISLRRRPSCQGHGRILHHRRRAPNPVRARRMGFQYCAGFRIPLHLSRCDSIAEYTASRVLSFAVPKCRAEKACFTRDDTDGVPRREPAPRRSGTGSRAPSRTRSCRDSLTPEARRQSMTIDEGQSVRAPRAKAPRRA